MIDDEGFMRATYRFATENGSDPSLSPSVGLLGMGRSWRRAEHHDAVAHAEIEVIRAAGASFENGELREATLYTALQPCGMCTTAAIWLKVGRNVFGAGREDVHKMYFEARHVDTAGFRCQGLQGRSVEGGILRDECAAVLPHLGRRPT